MFAFRNIIIRCQKQNIGQYPNISILVKNHHNKKPVPVAWEKPEIGWTKLNFDGSSKAKSASIGGVFRNHKAEFLLGYAESIGKANSTVAELAALRRGLELVLANGWSDMWLEGDAMSLVEIIARQREVVIRCAEVQRHILGIREIIPQLNGCIVSHVYREGNRTADKLAQIGHQLKKPRVWTEPPREVLRFVHEDAEGKIIYRRR